MLASRWRLWISAMTKMFWRTLPISSAYACSQPFNFLGPPTLQILTVVRYSVVFCFRHTSPSDLIDFQTLFPALLQSASCWSPQERRLRGAGYFVGSSENHELTPQSLVQTSWQRPHHCMIGCDTVVLYLFYIILYLVCHSTLLHLLRYPNVSDVSLQTFHKETNHKPRAWLQNPSKTQHPPPVLLQRVAPPPDLLRGFQGDPEPKLSNWSYTHKYHQILIYMPKQKRAETEIDLD